MSSPWNGLVARVSVQGADGFLGCTPALESLVSHSVEVQGRLQGLLSAVLWRMGGNPIEWAWGRGYQVDRRIQVSERTWDFFVYRREVNNEEFDPFLTTHFILSQHFSIVRSLFFFVIHLSYKNNGS